MSRTSVCLLILAFAGFAAADLYMQNPRGNNDRLAEANTNRNNGNRLFDSQNNGKGGYCWGPPMTFYEGSQLSIEWTNQHACNNPKIYCNLVIQFMCSKADADPLVRVRDGSGSTTNTIDDNPTAAAETETDPDFQFPNDNNRNLKFGLNEAYTNWLACKTSQRNMGLFIADREQEGGLNAGRKSARFTRQNNNGNRNGYECAEERDYYPYWRPSPWMDVAVLTQDEDWCSFYRSESENVKGRYVCNGDLTPAADENNPRPISEAACLNRQGKWEQQPSHGLGAPDCVKAEFSRDNHLGNGVSGFAHSYNWTLPKGSSAKQLECVDSDNCHCVLRMRYNISQSDVGTHNPASGFLDWTYNANQNGEYREGLSPMPPKDDEIKTVDGLPHQLALDTTQFGRTFQDRSFVFHIKKRPSKVDDFARIHNLNVRGKRGNIVQTYPATEYDFVPTFLGVRVNDWVHFQWTGCDTNPAGNAGEGTDQTDRSNIVQLSQFDAASPATDEWLADNQALFESKWLRMHLAYLEQPYQDATDSSKTVGNSDDNIGANEKRCMTYEDLLTANNNNQNNAEQDKRNCMKLNAAPAYFDGGLVAMNKTGTYFFMSSRNNNFTNRGQKGSIFVAELLPTWAIALIVVGGVLFLASMGVAGALFYAKSHPHSQVAAYLSKL